MVAVPLVGMLIGSACFPAALPAFALPLMQGAAVAMAAARCHATALALWGGTATATAAHPLSAGTLVHMTALLLSALGGVTRAVLLVCIRRCYFWATSRALAALNGCLLLVAVATTACLDPPAVAAAPRAKLDPEVTILTTPRLYSPLHGYTHWG